MKQAQEGTPASSLPHEFLALGRRERAFLVAAIEERVEMEKEKQKKLERKPRNRGRR